MPASQYLIVIALGFGIIAVGALPLLIASVVMLVPRRLPRRRRFVMVSGGFELRVLPALSRWCCCHFSWLARRCPLSLQWMGIRVGHRRWTSL